MSYVKVEVSLHGLRHDSLAAVLSLIESSLRSTFDLDLEGDVEVEPIESAGLAGAGGQCD